MFNYVYLSGPISGQDYEERFKAFEEMSLHNGVNSVGTFISVQFK